MGWSGGTSLMYELVAVLKKNVPDAAARKAVYKKMIAEFEEHDCDTLTDCTGKDEAFDAVLKALYQKRGWWAEED